MLDDQELLYKIASLYYEERKNQQEISALLDISRPMISRALAKAEKLGIVRIHVIPPAGCSPTEVRLAEKLGITRVVIGQIPAPSANDQENRIKAIASRANEYIAQIVSNDMTVGVGWGVTVHHTVLSLSSYPTLKGITVVPIVGSAGRTETHYQVNIIADHLAEKLQGNALFFNIPAFVTDYKIHDFFKRDPQMKAIQERWKHLDVALIGLGAFGGTPSFPVADYSLSALEDLQRQRVKGDILGRFFNQEGILGDVAQDDSLITRNMSDVNSIVYLGIPVESLKRSKQIICLCGGDQKIPAIRTAAQFHLFDCLVTDSQTAKELENILG
ncbi:MAG: sugar-binding transcriptional regulator [Sphaerochaetaceae bacterium]